MKKTLVGMFLLALMAMPAYAVEGTTAGKTMSYIEFSSIPENHGASLRLVQKRYEDYRQGKFPVATLDTSRLR